MTSKKSQSGFTLVELVIVIAILAMLATLAVNKLSGIKADNAKKINLANLARVDSIIDTYLAASPRDGLNRLDSLTLCTASSGTPGDLSGLTSQTALMIYTNEANTGLSADLFGPPNPYAAAPVVLLGTWWLSAAEAAVLERDLGIKYVMAGTDGTMSNTGDDGAWAQGDLLNPDACASYAKHVTNGLPVAVVNPGATRDRTPVGPAVYKSCGQNVAYSYRGKILVDDVEQADNHTAVRTLYGSTGILLAFGLGDNCAAVGNNVGGFDSAPVSPVMNAGEYRRYLVLVRLKGTVSSTGAFTPSSAEYAGVMDPRGNILSSLRSELK